MTTNYVGIDYGHGKTNVDAATGIRFGVISQNSLDFDAMDEVFQKSEDLTHKQCVSQLKAEIADIKTESDLAEIIEERFHCRCNPKLWAEAILLERTTNDGIITQIDGELVEHIWSEIEDTFNDQYYDCGERDWLYESDGYKLTNCLQNDVMILASRYFTYAQFCSPCVPGACNLDSPIDPNTVVNAAKAYCLGHDWFIDGRAPYPVFSVETGEMIAP